MPSLDPNRMSAPDGPARSHPWRDALLALAIVGIAAAGALLTPAQAAQNIEVRDGDTTIVRISLRDQTRLRVAGGRIVDVIGDTYDAQRNPAGRLVVLKDDAEGEVYLRPVLPATGAERAPGAAAPVKLDVKTDRGTVGLVLQPAEVIGDTLTLRVTGGTRPGADVSPQFKGAAHVRAIKALTLAMASPALTGELPARTLPQGGQELALWREARFVLKARYDAPGLVGEAYELTNVSGQRMVIDERELYRDGVLGVALRQLALAPGESTPVWIVRDPQTAR